MMKMPQQPSLDEMMKSPQAAELMKDQTSLMGLANSPDAQKLIQLLNQNAGGQLKGAAEAAMKGDTSQLIAVLNQVIQSPDGARAVEGIQKKLPKK